MVEERALTSTVALSKSTERERHARRYIQRFPSHREARAAADAVAVAGHRDDDDKSDRRVRGREVTRAAASTSAGFFRRRRPPPPPPPLLLSPYAATAEAAAFSGCTLSDSPVP